MHNVTHYGELYIVCLEGPRQFAARAMDNTSAHKGMYNAGDQAFLRYDPP